MDTSPVLPELRPAVLHQQVTTSNQSPSEISSQKRRRTDARLIYPRKRAVAACEPCRARKTKCDNQRPSCGACTSSGAMCIFRDQNSDHSSFDQASLAILDRVNYAIHLLEGQSTASQSQPVAVSDTPAHSVEDTSLGHAGTLSWAGASPGIRVGQTDDVGIALSDALNISSRPACTHVLEWPVFQGRIKPEFISPALIDPTAQQSRTQTEGMRPVTQAAARIHEDDIVELVEHFLTRVHTKNPILDPIALLNLARNVAEEGFAWDNTTCLVLIACALGSIATDWDVGIPTETENSLSSTKTYRLAEAYYTATRKRLGLLDYSVMATQSWFLTGVYEMYSMRPLTAWSSFNRACTMLQLHLHTQSRDDGPVFARPEQCLYWSSLKSECEMREELDLPPSGLAIIGYPGNFPSPPGSTPAPEGSADSMWESVHERSWYYYLSDIAFRRIANYTTTAVYGMPKEQWLTMGVKRLARIAEELDTQTLQWWGHIPGSPAPSLQEDTDELTFMLRLNYVDLRERIWRPFIYVALHGTPTEAEMGIVRTGANKCLDMSFETLQGARLKHRHHGLWLTVRCMFTKALLIIAASKSERLELPSDWALSVYEFQAYLRYWEVEAPDLGAMRVCLAELLEGSPGT